MKIISIMLLLITFNLYAKTEIFEINKKRIYDTDLKSISYEMKANTYRQNIFVIKELIKTINFIENKRKKEKKIFEQIQDKLKDRKYNYILKTEIEMKLYKELKLSSYKISEQEKREYFEKNQSEFEFGKMVKGYYILAKNKEDIDNIINSIKYSSNRLFRIRELAQKRNQKEFVFKYSNKQDIYKLFGDKKLFNILYNKKLFNILYNKKLKEQKLIPYFIKKYNKYCIFYITGKLKNVKAKYRIANPYIDKKLREIKFFKENADLIKNVKNKNIIIFEDNIKKISKKGF